MRLGCMRLDSPVQLLVDWGGGKQNNARLQSQATISTLTRALCFHASKINTVVLASYSEQAGVCFVGAFLFEEFVLVKGMFVFAV